MQKGKIGHIKGGGFQVFTLVVQMVRNLPVMQETWVRSVGQEDPLGRVMATIPVFLPGEFHGHWSLAGYSPWGRNESDTAEQLTPSFSLLNKMEGNYRICNGGVT